MDVFLGVVLFDNVELLKYCVFTFLNWFFQQAWSWGFPVVDHQGPAHRTRCLPGDNAGSRPIYEQSTVKRTRAALFPAWVAPDVRALADRHLVRVTQSLGRHPIVPCPLIKVRPHEKPINFRLRFHRETAILKRYKNTWHRTRGLCSKHTFYYSSSRL